MHPLIAAAVMPLIPSAVASTLEVGKQLLSGVKQALPGSNRFEDHLGISSKTEAPSTLSNYLAENKIGHPESLATHISELKNTLLKDPSLTSSLSEQARQGPWLIGVDESGTLALQSFTGESIPIPQEHPIRGQAQLLYKMCQLRDLHSTFPQTGLTKHVQTVDRMPLPTTGFSASRLWVG